jgi:hypothetical protein
LLGLVAFSARGANRLSMRCAKLLLSPERSGETGDACCFM